MSTETVQDYKTIPNDKFQDILDDYYKSGAEELAKQINSAMIKQGNVVVHTPMDKRGI